MDEPQQISTGAIAAIFSGLTAIITALAIRGGPAIAAWWSRSDALEQTRIAQAKEGPTMVIARLEVELKELKERFDRLSEKYELIRDKHQNCESEQAGLKKVVEFQAKEIEELKQEVDMLNKRTAA